ncbi:MAG: hypothetical protein Q9221_001422 [Calogaya cf. arnoldii]
MTSLPVEHTPLRFLDFPREVRDKVYNELLLAEKRFSKTRDKYDFRLNILKINKQTAEEAYEVLYKGNQWVKIQEEERSLKQILKHFEWTYLVSSDRFEDICLALSIAKEKASLYARISLSFRKPCRDNKRLQDKLSDCLLYLPQFDLIDATGLNPAPLRLGIIDDLTTSWPRKLTDPEFGLKSYELEGDLCLRATAAGGAKAKANLSVNSNLATKKYNRALSGNMTLLAEASAADQSAIPMIIEHRLLPLVCKLKNTAAGCRTKDDEGLISLQLLVTLLRNQHLPSSGNAEIFSSIAEIARGRRDYSLAVYALLQAQEHLSDDWRQFEKAVVRLWKSILKGSGDQYRRAHLSLLYGRFEHTVSKLALPSDCSWEMLSENKNSKELMGGFEAAWMREAEGRLMELGNEEVLVVKS